MGSQDQKDQNLTEPGRTQVTDAPWFLNFPPEGSIGYEEWQKLLHLASTLVLPDAG